MSALSKCSAIHGNIFYSAINPLAVAFENALVSPRNPLISFDDDHKWGVYTSSGANISLAAYRRGPHQDRVGQSQTINLAAESTVNTGECMHIYIGPQIFHHGHFLLTSLSRLWPLLKIPHRNFKLIYHGDHDIKTICDHIPIANATLKAFGLSPEHFIRPIAPTVFEQLFIPAPSFEETNSAHQIHSDVGTKIGKFLKSGQSLRAFMRPVMLSKTKLASGVGRFSNEDEITNVLSRKGVEIIYPETLSLAEQINVFETAPAVVSYAGSALHTSLLTEKSATIIGLNLGEVMGSSQILVDALKGNNAEYFYPTHTRKSFSGTTFAATLRVDDPIGVADAILREIDLKTNWRARLKNFNRKLDPLKSLAYPGVQSLWP
ncbi:MULTISPECIES: glycosyltransferase family 61 protein [unclassified Methylobacterium]|uniref:glycosyltransferase family 61 protein n=1 Tax=unclassified Methylobacterium TaxID=2615210 RepID=UPI0009E9D945|nr:MULTISPECIES: glycosyltransferase family 61 protein [unclassified Methylobacterium]